MDRLGARLAFMRTFSPATLELSCIAYKKSYAPHFLTGTDYPNGTVGFRLATGPGNTKVFRSVNLRERFRIEDFDSMNYGEVRMDGSSNGGLLQFTITSMRVGD